MTDGVTNRGGDPFKGKIELTKQGIEVYTIGIGNKINADQLKKLASDSNHYIKSDWSVLNTALKGVLTIACPKVVIPTPVIPVDGKCTKSIP